MIRLASASLKAAKKPRSLAKKLGLKNLPRIFLDKLWKHGHKIWNNRQVAGIWIRTHASSGTNAEASRLARHSELSSTVLEV